MKKYIFLIVVLLIGFLVWFVPEYDQTVALRENVHKEWAQIDTLLQRRYAVIPNLVSTSER